MESTGFKEWAIVCEAMGRGRQSIILRKGGIAEGRDGFSFKYPRFFLFPTWFHEQPEKVREMEGADGGFSGEAVAKTEGRIGDEIAPLDTQDQVEIRYAAVVDRCHTIRSWDVAQALEPLHILQPEVVRERFEYDEAPGLQVAFVRVLRLTPRWRFPNDKKYGGCRSWVSLPALPDNIQAEAVLSDQEHWKRLKEFLGVVGENLAR